MISTDNPATIEAYVGERLPFVAVFQLELERFATSIRCRVRLRGYVQFDMAHKGDM